MELNCPSSQFTELEKNYSWPFFKNVEGKGGMIWENGIEKKNECVQDFFKHKTDPLTNKPPNSLSL